jgi:hypothetical protein
VGAVLNIVQADKVASSIATLMQDCNTHFANALCTSISVPDMSSYHYLTGLDFVKDVSGCKTHFDRMPHDDVRFPHLQLFPKLATELFKVDRLLGSSNSTYVIFTSHEIHLCLVHYMVQMKKHGSLKFRLMSRNSLFETFLMMCRSASDLSL